MAQEDLSPEEELGSYLLSPGSLTPQHQWRAVVEYRCKRSHLLGSVIKLRQSYVLYTLRRDRRWQADATDMVFELPGPREGNAHAAVSIGGCRCQSVRTRELGRVLNDIDRQRGQRRSLRVTV